MVPFALEPGVLQRRASSNASLIASWAVVELKSSSCIGAPR